LSAFSFFMLFFFFSSRRRHTRFSRDWSSDVCSSDLKIQRSSAPSVRYFSSISVAAVAFAVHAKHCLHPIGFGPVQVQTARESERSEEHTSELQSRENFVCRLLLEKKKWKRYITSPHV